MRKLLVLAAAVFIAYAARSQYTATTADAAIGRPDSRAELSESASGLVSGEGTVIRVLPDDNDGDRHQRFILRLASGKTLLVAHNIDIAPRVSPLSEGDTVEYRGEFVWNDKGGVVHWTHHDPSGHHPAGWLKHAGRTFQ